MDDLTPVELRDGLWYKREDLYRNEKYGVNGAKFRACRHLMMQAILEEGAGHVISASSVLSPQAAMAGVLAEEMGLKCTIIVGATTPEKAVKHKSIAIASAAGADIMAVKVGYNPFIQKAAREAALRPGWWQLPYGITTPANASPAAVQAFLQVGGAQVANLPDEIETLVIPFGSGNTAAGVLHGLVKQNHPGLKRVILVGIGPDRLDWVTQRLGGLPGIVEHIPLHGWFADYGDVMRETSDGIVMHPTYEGKVVRYLNMAKPEWWTRRDGTTCFWVVGGPL